MSSFFYKLQQLSQEEDSGVEVFIDEDGDEDWESVSHVDGFGKLQHQLGVLAAIAYLDFNDFSK